METFSLHYDGMVVEGILWDNGVTIVDSYKIKNDETKRIFIKLLVEKYPHILNYRSEESLFQEWKSHNILYQRGISPKSTKSSDLEFHQKLFHKIGYKIISKWKER